MQEPEPPPVVVPPPPPKFVPAAPAQKQTAFDLSGTDSRTVISLTLFGAGLMTWFACFLIGPIAPVAGLIIGLFAKPSTLRTVAIVGNVLVLALSIIWLFAMFWDMATDPVLRQYFR